MTTLTTVERLKMEKQIIERQASLFDRSNNKSAPILADRSYEREIICIFVFNLEYL